MEIGSIFNRYYFHFNHFRPFHLFILSSEKILLSVFFQIIDTSHRLRHAQLQILTQSQRVDMYWWLFNIHFKMVKCPSLSHFPIKLSRHSKDAPHFTTVTSQSSRCLRKISLLMLRRSKHSLVPIVYWQIRLGNGFREDCWLLTLSSPLHRLWRWKENNYKMCTVFRNQNVLEWSDSFSDENVGCDENNYPTIQFPHFVRLGEVRFFIVLGF